MNGWYDGSVKITPFTIADSDKTFYASWNASQYTISYNVNGHGEQKAYGPTSYTIESSIITPTSNPSEEGYTFTGWTPPSIPSGSVGNKEFKANWGTSSSHIVRFYNGGVLLKEQTVTHGGSATAPSNPTKTGYTFIGWDKDFTNVT